MRSGVRALCLEGYFPGEFGVFVSLDPAVAVPSFAFGFSASSFPGVLPVFLHDSAVNAVAVRELLAREDPETVARMTVFVEASQAGVLGVQGLRQRADQVGLDHYVPGLSPAEVADMLAAGGRWVVPVDAQLRPVVVEQAVGVRVRPAKHVLARLPSDRRAGAVSGVFLAMRNQVRYVPGGVQVGLTPSMIGWLVADSTLPERSPGFDAGIPVGDYDDLVRRLDGLAVGDRVTVYADAGAGGEPLEFQASRFAAGVAVWRVVDGAAVAATLPVEPAGLRLVLPGGFHYQAVQKAFELLRARNPASEANSLERIRDQAARVLDIVGAQAAVLEPVLAADVSTIPNARSLWDGAVQGLHELVGGSWDSSLEIMRAASAGIAGTYDAALHRVDQVITSLVEGEPIAEAPSALGVDDLTINMVQFGGQDHGLPPSLGLSSGLPVRLARQRSREDDSDAEGALAPKRRHLDSAAVGSGTPHLRQEEAAFDPLPEWEAGQVYSAFPEWEAAVLRYEMSGEKAKFRPPVPTLKVVADSVPIYQEGATRPPTSSVTVEQLVLLLHNNGIWSGDYRIERGGQRARIGIGYFPSAFTQYERALSQYRDRSSPNARLPRLDTDVIKSGLSKIAWLKNEKVVLPKRIILDDKNKVLDFLEIDRRVYVATFDKGKITGFEINESLLAPNPMALMVRSAPVVEMMPESEAGPSEAGASPVTEGAAGNSAAGFFAERVVLSAGRAALLVDLREKLETPADNQIGILNAIVAWLPHQFEPGGPLADRPVFEEAVTRLFYMDDRRIRYRYEDLAVDDYFIQQTAMEPDSTQIVIDYLGRLQGAAENLSEVAGDWWHQQMQQVQVLGARMLDFQQKFMDVALRELQTVVAPQQYAVPSTPQHSGAFPFEQSLIPLDLPGHELQPDAPNPRRQQAEGPSAPEQHEVRPANRRRVNRESFARYLAELSAHRAAEEGQGNPEIRELDGRLPELTTDIVWGGLGVRAQERGEEGPRITVLTLEKIDEFLDYVKVNRSAYLPTWRMYRGIDGFTVNEKLLSRISPYNLDYDYSPLTEWKEGVRAYEAALDAHLDDPAKPLPDFPELHPSVVAHSVRKTEPERNLTRTSRIRVEDVERLLRGAGYWIKDFKIVHDSGIVGVHHAPGSFARYEYELARHRRGAGAFPELSPDIVKNGLEKKAWLTGVARRIKMPLKIGDKHEFLDFAGVRREAYVHEWKEGAADFTIENGKIIGFTIDESVRSGVSPYVGRAWVGDVVPAGVLGDLADPWGARTRLIAEAASGLSGGARGVSVVPGAVAGDFWDVLVGLESRSVGLGAAAGVVEVRAGLLRLLGALVLAAPVVGPVLDADLAPVAVNARRMWDDLVGSVKGAADSLARDLGRGGHEQQRELVADGQSARSVFTTVADFYSVVMARLREVAEALTPTVTAPLLDPAPRETTVAERPDWFSDVLARLAPSDAASPHVHVVEPESGQELSAALLVKVRLAAAALPEQQPIIVVRRASGRKFLDRASVRRVVRVVQLFASSQELLPAPDRRMPVVVLNGGEDAGLQAALKRAELDVPVVHMGRKGLSDTWYVTLSNSRASRELPDFNLAPVVGLARSAAAASTVAQIPGEWAPWFNARSSAERKTRPGPDHHNEEHFRLVEDWASRLPDHRAVRLALRELEFARAKAPADLIHDLAAAREQFDAGGDAVHADPSIPLAGKAFTAIVVGAPEMGDLTVGLLTAAMADTAAEYSDEHEPELVDNARFGREVLTAISDLEGGEFTGAKLDAYLDEFHQRNKGRLHGSPELRAAWRDLVATHMAQRGTDLGLAGKAALERLQAAIFRC